MINSSFLKRFYLSARHLAVKRTLHAERTIPLSSSNFILVKIWSNTEAMTSQWGGDKSNFDINVNFGMKIYFKYINLSDPKPVLSLEINQNLPEVGQTNNLNWIQCFSSLFVKITHINTWKSVFVTLIHLILKLFSTFSSTGLNELQKR